ncbi:MAG: PIN domain-containing protein [Candidatus Aminicenantes bacterium]|nr:PIN domain-containing protein [Candidatus Aminicenantes bacterium]NIM82105.1 PIN domain-containing protein [Candidatus Aminicenantes bacterium]NIN21500.1 PIN domain-containing protein [Candidatus Aminicenantes bacterium]NIN45311.1 PIN domain-containing protein [Candidatus Aminicenantes bacterium]NIN88128.1 PIN domain-containing protein [Candidatus Aminicenantes bacterium]
MMLFFDTNVIVYSIVNLDEEKLKISQQLVNTALEENSILISPLILQEMIFTLGKLGVESDVIEENVDLWTNFSISSIENDIVKEAFDLCKKANNFRIISDAIHLKIAEKYCTKLVTFDKDFKQLRSLTDFKIEILQQSEENENTENKEQKGDNQNNLPELETS